MLFWAPLFTGLAFGLSAGVSPGPLMALVIAQSIRHSAREGMVSALAPLATDGPLILVAWFMLDRLPAQNIALGIISLLGALVIFYLGWENFRAPTIEVDQAESIAPKSFLKAITVNYLSPHPYLFWTTVGAPILVIESQHGGAGPVGFVAGFMTGLVGTKCVIAVVASRYTAWLSGRGFRLLMRLLGIVMFLLGLGLIREAVKLLGWVK